MSLKFCYLWLVKSSSYSSILVFLGPVALRSTLWPFIRPSHVDSSAFLFSISQASIATGVPTQLYVWKPHYIFRLRKWLALSAQWRVSVTARPCLLILDVTYKIH